MVQSLIVSGFLLFNLVACTSVKSPSDNTYAKDFHPIEPPAKIVILPVEDQYKELAKGKPIIVAEISGQLGNLGYQSLVFDESSYEKLRNEAIEKTGGLYDSRSGKMNTAQETKAAQFLITAVSTQTECSLILSPRIVLKTVKLSNDSASWDGVQRRLRVLFGGTYGQTWSGETKAVSVELKGYRPDGSWQFTSYGGISLIFDVDMREPKNKIRQDLFDDKREIKEAVELVLRPLRDAQL